MNAGIILAGQQPDFVNVLARSNAAAQQNVEMQRQNALRQLYQEQGAGIAAGNQGAINALAQFSPEAALNVQGARQGLAQGELNMQATKQRMDVLSAQEKRAIQTHAAQMSAAERAAMQQQIEQGLMRGVQMYQAGDLPGLNALLQQAGEQPIASLEEFPSVAVRYNGVMDALKEVAEFSEKDSDEPAAVQSLRIRAQEAGLQPGSREYQEFMANGGAKKNGMRLETMPDGRVIFTEGDIAGDSGRIDPTSTDAMISSIDGILNDSALDTSTGMLSFLQNVPGTPQRRFGARAKQLEGQAFLQAFESLKGAGQITEIEGAKATQAIGRLDTAQSADDYREALTELRGILDAAQKRPAGWAEQQENAADTQKKITPQTYQDFETFKADPGVIAAAKKAGVTPEDMWQVLKGGGS